MQTGMDRNARWLAPAGLMMVVAFFGPWIDVQGLIRASAYDLATLGKGWRSHVLWLLPAGGAALAAAALAGARAARTVGLATGAVSLAITLYALTSDLRYGAWLTVVGAVTAIISASTKDHRGGALLAGLLVVAGFFLPWIGEGRVVLSGFDLARLPSSGAGPDPSWLYAVPALGALSLVAGLSARARALAVAAGVATLAVLAYVYVRSASLVLGWGIWLTLAAGASALLIPLLSRRRP